MAADWNDDDLEFALTDFLSKELGSQRGRTLGCFRQHIDELSRRFTRRGWSRRALLTWGAVGLAASAAWVAAALAFQLHPTPGRHLTTRDPQPSQPMLHFGDPVERVLAWRSEEGDTVILPDGTPARQVVRREYERTRWVDPVRNVSVERTSPRDQIMLIPIQTY